MKKVTKLMVKTPLILIGLLLILYYPTAEAQNLAQTAIITSAPLYDNNVKLADDNTTNRWLTAPNIATQYMQYITFQLTKSIYTANIDLYSISQPFYVEISAEGTTWINVKSFANYISGISFANFKIYNNAIAFKYIRFVVSVPVNTQMSIAEIGITEIPVQSISAPNNTSNVFTNALDGNLSSYFEFVSTNSSDFTYNINLTDNIKALKLRIKASDKGIKVDLTDPLGNIDEGYYNTLMSDEEFLIINPQTVKSIQLTKKVSSLNLYEIDVTPVNFSGTSMGFSYNDNGQMTMRTILFSGLKSASSRSGLSDTIIIRQNAVKDMPFEDMLSERKVLVYPNPTEGLLKVVVENKEETDNINLQLYNIQGKKLYNNTLINNEEIIDLTRQANGTYFLNITINGKMHTWKIIKQ